VWPPPLGRKPGGGFVVKLFSNTELLSFARILMKGTDMFAVLIKLLKSEEGATAIEYGLIATLVSIAGIAAFNAVGSSLTSTFNNVSSKL